MRRILAMLATTIVVAVGLAPGSGLSPASAGGGPLTGRLVDSSTSTVVGVPNMSVQLRKVADGGGLGSVVDSDVTASDGSFSLDAAPTDGDEFYVQVLPGAFQGGWVGGDPAYVQPELGNAVTFGPHVSIGRILAVPAFIHGKMVNASTGNPVRGVTVRMFRNGTVQGEDVSNSNGIFRIGGLDGEDDFEMQFRGQAKGYENGWYSCFKTVVAFDNACAPSLGKVGKIRIEKL